MPEIQTARETLSHLLVDIQDVDESVVRGEKKLGGQTYAVAYVDLADDVVERSQHLREFQERVLGDDFFDAPGDLRWNKYLYIVAGPNSKANPEFAAAKASIEADKDYARKRVVSEADLESLLGGAKLFEAAASGQSYDVLADWEQRLATSRLDLLLDCATPRTGVVDRIGQGDARRAADSRVRAKTLHASDEQIAASKLRSLTISRFRPIHDGRKYDFGDVTLVVGANGTGKTSLLEAIEYFYCGNNRRSNSTSAIRMKGMLSPAVGEGYFEVASTTDGPRIKARCLAWYNREERNVDSIVGSFSLYNFLDTDAAYRLSGNLKPADVSTELSRLLVGPTAATTFDYFQKIRGDVEKAWDKTQRRVEKQQEELATGEKRLKELQDQPSSAKTLVDSYRAALATLAWLQVPQGPIPQPSEGQELLAALGHVQALASSGDAARTIRDIERRSDELRAAVEAVAPYGEQLSDFTGRAKNLAAQIEEHEATIGLLDRWIAYETSGFNDVRRRYPLAREAVHKLTGRLGNLVVGNLPEIPPRYFSLPLEVALREATETASKAEKRAAGTRELLSLHGKAASARAAAAASLRDAAMAAVKISDAPDTCPVCRTVHAVGSLVLLIEELTSRAGDSPELSKLVESLRTAETEASEAKRFVVDLEFCKTVANALSLNADLAPGTVLEELANLRKQAADAQAALKRVTEEDKDLARAGFSSNECDLIWGRISKLFGAATTLPTMYAATEAKGLQSQATETKRQSLAHCRQSLDAVVQSIKSICMTVEMDGWSTRTTTIDTVTSLVALRDEFVAVSKHVGKLRSQMQVTDEAPFAELQVRLAEVASAFKQAEVAVTSESANSAEQRDLPSKIETCRRALLNSMSEALAYKTAMATLDDIFVNASLETATAEALAAIGGQINEVFTRIHAPHEYEYVGSRDVLLRKTETHESRSLDEVSTGQRAAFALSIFLARNRTAKSAPPLLLIDDPIAHVDDLNALSFLDYLRDLAVNSGRQIFFATADTRIASLFSKKFSFLGDSFKTINLVRTAELGVSTAD